MSYKVTMQYRNGSETACHDIKSLRNLNETEAEIIDKMRADSRLNLDVIYRIREWDDLIKEFDPTKITLPPEETTGSQGQGQSASFRPTPLNTSPRPPGSPQKWVRDEEEEDDEK